jgi:hypothetical protein
MKHKVIHTDNYLLVVDDSEIKKSDFCYDEEADPGYNNQKGITKCLRTASDSYWNKHCKKIIAHLPLNNSPILDGVDLLPPLEDEVEKLADEIVGDSIYYEEDRVNLSDGIDLFMLGYNKAKEKYKYTEEDMRIAIQQAFLSGVERLEDFGKVESMIIGNIQQPKMLVAFEHENTIRPDTGDLLKEAPAQWVGRYIYE